MWPLAGSNTQFLSSPVGMLWVGHTILSQLRGKDKDGEVPNNRFQTVTTQAHTKKASQ